jgi:amidase
MAERRDPFNAFLDLPQAPVTNAKSGPLAGLRLAVKDIFDVAGYPTGCGNPQRAAEASPACKTAAAVQTLLDAGARFVGKTQTDELAFSLMGQNAHFRQPVNPAAPDRVTGGSSSGSAAAVAGGVADIAVGSDTGGSIRAPASFCGLVGLRTTHGAIALDGAMPLAPSLDTFGWFARDIETYKKVAEVLLGENGAAPHPYPLPVKDGERGASTSRPSSFSQFLRGEGPAGDEGPGEIRALAIPTLDGLVLPDAEAEYVRIRELVANVTGAPAAAPALSHDIGDLYWCFRKLQAHEAWASQGSWISARDRGLGPGVKERFDFGATIASETAEAETARRDDFRYELAGLLGSGGILILPTVPGAAPLKSASFKATQAYRERALHLLCLSGLSGFPQISLPLGAVDGAPFGVSLLGPAGSDLALIRLGRRILEAASQ